MRGRETLLLIVILLGLRSQVQGATGDSLRYLTPKDTIFLTVGHFQEKIFKHRMEPKQTLYSLAGFYGLSVEELYYYNPGLKDEVVHAGDSIRVPIPNTAIIRYQEPGYDPEKYAPVFYRVKRGDTMFRISRYFFRMPIDTLLSRSHMGNIDLRPGQLLRIGWMSIEGVPEVHRHLGESALSRRNEAMRQVYMRESEGKREREDQGAAYWKKNSRENSDFYALHRRAPINSVIEVENPMSRRKVYVKVVGRIPDTAYEDNVVLILSPIAARLLGAIDPKFFVRVRYYR
ncbi:MAG: LysM peptidoglycan-binding domain-containing protein [Saprospiraceae bacterium]|nr:LysM peptidoglycan-binding domain-containing protein [Saprospiraceae bacterium]